MKKNRILLLSGLLATSALLSVAGQTAKAATVSEDGVNAPIVLNHFLGTDAPVDQQLVQTGNGRQFLQVDGEGYSSVPVYIRDATSGEYLRTVFSDVNVAIANRNEDVFIGVNSWSLYAATRYDDETEILYEGISNSIEDLDGFIGETNKFVGHTSNQWFVYDYDLQKILLKRQLPSYETLIEVGNDVIAVASDQTITLYDEDGNYLDIIQLDSEIIDLTFTPDRSELAVTTSGENIAFYDASSFEKIEKVGFTNTDNSIDITYDPTGNYVAVHSLGDKKTKKAGFRLFKTETGERIYTSIDSEENAGRYSYKEKDNILLSNNAQFIYYAGTTYNGKNITKYPTGLQTKTYTIGLNESLTPEAIVKLANGKTESVTSGVTWKSSDLSKGYYDEETGKFKPKKLGTFKVQVSYLGFKKEVTIKVISTAFDHMQGNYEIDALGLAGIYLDQRIYKGGDYRYAAHIGVFSGKTYSGTTRTYLEVARKSSTPIYMKKVVLIANGKKLTKKVSSYEGYTYESSNYVKLSDSDMKWLKTNIKANKTVKIQYVGKKKTIQKTLNTNQKKSLIDNVAVREALKKVK